MVQKKNAFLYFLVMLVVFGLVSSVHAQILTKSAASSISKSTSTSSTATSTPLAITTPATVATTVAVSPTTVATSPVASSASPTTTTVAASPVPSSPKLTTKATVSTTSKPTVSTVPIRASGSSSTRSSRNPPHTAYLMTPPSLNYVLLGTPGSPVALAPSTLADARETITEFDTSALMGGTYTDAVGTTDTNNYIRLEQLGINPFTTSGQVLFGQNNAGVIDDYLYFQDATDIFEFETEFQNGFESTIDPATNDLVELEGQRFNILGKSFYMADTDLIGNAVTLRLVTSTYTALLNEGSTQVLNIRGIPQTIEILNVDPTGDGSVDIRIDGNTVNGLQEGEYGNIGQGGVAVLDTIAGTPDQVLLVLDVNALTFTDNNYNNFQFDPSVYVNGQFMNDARVSIVGNMIGPNFVLSSLYYRLSADGLTGNIYIPEGGELSTELANSEGMLHSDWDFFYGGLLPRTYTPLRIVPQGNSVYNLEFVNRLGLTYNIPFVDNSNNGGLGFQLGSATNELYFVEPNTACDFFIGEDDFFVLTNDNSPTGSTSVVRYDAFDDQNQEITFTDLSFGTTVITYNVVPNFCGAGTTVGQGNLVMSGNSYPVYINLDQASPTYGFLTIDFTNDGNVDGDEANIVLQTGQTVDLNTANNGLLQQEPALSNSFTIGVRTQMSMMSHASQDEVITVDLLNVAGNNVDADVTSGVNMVPDPSLPGETGLSPYGIFVTSVDPDPNAITFDIPDVEQWADVYITFDTLPECSDGIDNDFDGLIDFPADPVCPDANGETESPSNRLCGDIDRSGVVDVIDALFAAQHSALIRILTGADFACGDVDSNGIVDVLDSLRIAQYGAALPVTLTCTQACI